MEKQSLLYSGQNSILFALDFHLIKNLSNYSDYLYLRTKELAIIGLYSTQLHSGLSAIEKHKIMDEALNRHILSECLIRRFCHTN